MADQTPPPTASGPFWKTALVLWALALAGVVLVMPYVAVLQHQVLEQAAARTHLALPVLLTISGAQSGVLLALAVIAGLWASRKLGLGTPLIAALLTRRPLPPRTFVTLLVALALGAAAGLAIVALDHWVFAPLPAVAELIRSAAAGGANPSPWLGFLASFYGALDEEILTRLGLLSLLALGLRSLARVAGLNGAAALPPAVFWTANVAAAVLFGLGHLPATAALAPLSTTLVIRAIVLNGLGGLVFGELYRRFGLEWAMAAHFGADLVLHVATGL